MINEVSSPSHPVKASVEGGQGHGKTALVTLATPDSSLPLTTDFHLKISLAEPNKYLLFYFIYFFLFQNHYAYWCTCRPVFRVQQNVAMLALYPELSTEDDPITEMIFLVDRCVYWFYYILFNNINTIFHLK